MNTLRTIATVLAAAFLVLGPVAAFGAGETVTVSTDHPSYSGMANIQISGTVTPAPSVSNTAVVVTTTGPMGAVDTGEAPVATSTGAYNFVVVSGGPSWTSGTYTVNATYGGPGGSGSAIVTFLYNATQSGNGYTVITVTISTTSTVTTTVGVQTVTTTTTVPSSDASALAGIQTSLNNLQSSIATISSGVSAIQTSLTSTTSGLGALLNVPSQVTTLTNDVNNNQTYVLVVAALAAITLVLELAILVRKLS